MKVCIGTAAGLAALFAAGACAATTLEFTYTSPSNSNGTASWTQSSMPIVLSHGGIYNTDTDVVVTDGTESFPGYGSDSFSDVDFYPSDNGGGFVTGGAIEVGDDGPAVYSGPESASVFSVGVYELDSGTLTVTADTVPEPAAWSMMLLGVVGVGAGLRTRRDPRLQEF